MRGHAHDRAGAVTEQHIIRDPDLNFLVVRRIDREAAREDACFFFGKVGALELALARSALAILANHWPLLFGHNEIDK